MVNNVTQPIVSDADPARGVRRTATGILIGLTAVFGATFLADAPPHWVLLVRAMAEAGMVGGLADWFAVEALFRRPLGLPFPHTALLPNNQKRAASNIAQFIDDHFLEPERLIAEIKKTAPVRSVANWLLRDGNAQVIGREFIWAIRMIGQVQPKSGVPDRLHEALIALLRDVFRDDRMADQTTELVKTALRSEILDEVVRQLRDLLDQNRDAVVEIVQDRSRWWIATGVDRRVATLLTGGVLSVLDELTDPASGRRDALVASVSEIVDAMRRDGKFASAMDIGLKDPALSRALASAVKEFIGIALRELGRKLSEGDAASREAATTTLRKIAQRLVDDPDLERAVSDRIETALGPVLASVRAPVRTYIAETISGWKSDELVDRIETEVGRDLQFIRINGAVLGAALGGILWVISILAE